MKRYIFNITTMRQYYGTLIIDSDKGILNARLEAYARFLAFTSNNGNEKQHDLFVKIKLVKTEEI